MMLIKILVLSFFLVAVLHTRSAKALIFRPKAPALLWDTWIFPWEGAYHLFYLRSIEKYRNDEIGHAVSGDLVHWEELPSIPTHPGTNTGFVVRYRDHFAMFHGYPINGEQQSRLIFSDDLIHWNGFENEPILKAAAPYLHRDGKHEGVVEWRDPSVTWREDWSAYEVLLTARLPRISPDNTGCCIARVRSRNLEDWQIYPPVAVGGRRFFHMECTEYFELGGKHYVTFSTRSQRGLRIDTSTRDNVAGIFYMMSDSRDGTYVSPPNDLLVGAGSGIWDSYAGRTLPWKGGRLLYHRSFR